MPSGLLHVQIQYLSYKYNAIHHCYKTFQCTGNKTPKKLVNYLKINNFSVKLGQTNQFKVS